MICRETAVIDTRDRDHVYEFLEAQIESLIRRIAELEAEKLERNVSNLPGMGMKLSSVGTA